MASLTFFILANQAKFSAEDAQYNPTPKVDNR
jgi:hypothetical protein